MLILELRNINKSFSDNHVLDGINLKVKSGNAFGLLGRNGAGKTTTIRIIMDVFPANSGEILLDGKPIDYSIIKTGYLPEERGLYPKKIIFDQLVYLAQLKGLSKKDAVKKVDYWINRLGMTQYRNKRLDTLSKGNQQKIQLVTAVAHDPQIIILDEPFSGLDPVNAQILKDVVKELIANGKIVLFSSHQMSYIEEFCDDIAILNKGKVALCGNLNEIKRDYVRDKLVVKSVDNDSIAKEFSDCSYYNDKNELIIKLRSVNDKKTVMSNLVAKYDIDEVKVYEPTLNDIFVEYAGDDAKEA